jgi:uncharacterized protein (TIGR00369 family)
VARQPGTAKMPCEHAPHRPFSDVIAGHKLAFCFITANINRRLIRRTKPMSTRSRIYGTVSADRQKAMSGLEFVQGLADATLPLNTIAEILAYDVIEAERGRVVITCEPNGSHLNPAGTVHGGLSATLLDSAMGLAIRSMQEKGVNSTTLEFKITLVRPITPETGVIKAEGVVLNCGRRVGTAEGRITDQQGKLLAHGTTTCLIF